MTAKAGRNCGEAHGFHGPPPQFLSAAVTEFPCRPFIRDRGRLHMPAQDGHGDPSNSRECLGRALDIVERLLAEGREEEALRYLRESILPALEELAREATR